MKENTNSAGPKRTTEKERKQRETSSRTDIHGMRWRRKTKDIVRREKSEIKCKANYGVLDGTYT